MVIDMNHIVRDTLNESGKSLILRAFSRQDEEEAAEKEGQISIRKGNFWAYLSLTPTIQIFRATSIFPSTHLCAQSSIDRSSSKMASSRTLLCVCSVLVLLLMADVAAAQADLPQQEQLGKARIPGSRKHLRDDLSIEAVKEGLESFEQRELSDYGSNSSGSNCSGNCKKK